MILTKDQIDALQELINIGVGQAAGVLNAMLSAHIELHIPILKCLTPDLAKLELAGQLGRDLLSAVQLCFNGSLQGNAELIFPTDSASKLVSVILNEELNSPDFDSLKIGALTEVGNIVISGVMGAISNVLNHNLDYVIPNYLEGSVDQLFTATVIEGETTILLAQTHFTIKQMNIQGDILLIFNVGSFQTLMTRLEKIYGHINE